MYRFLRNLRKILASTVIRNSVKNPKSPYSGALKTMLKLSQRSQILQSVQTLTKSIAKKVSSSRIIGKLVFWNPCFTTDCRDIYIYTYIFRDRRFASQLQPIFKCPQILKYKRYSNFRPQVFKIIVYTLVYIAYKNHLTSLTPFDDVINLTVFKL